MSEKKRQKKDGRDKNKKNQAMREHQPRESQTGKDKDNHSERRQQSAESASKSALKTSPV